MYVWKRWCSGLILSTMVLSMVHCSTERALNTCEKTNDCAGSQVCVAGYCFAAPQETAAGEDKGQSQEASTELDLPRDASLTDNPSLADNAQEPTQTEKTPDTVAEQSPQESTQTESSPGQDGQPAEQGGCAADTDCPAGESCVRGACQSGCQCPDNIDPVCAANGTSYNNQCEADCQRTKVLCKGMCPCPATNKCIDEKDCKLGQLCSNGICGACTCSKILKPVCGADGKTYDNDCLARCQHTTVQCANQCPCQTARCIDNNDCKAGTNCVKGSCQTCICTREYAPVCDSNGTTHSNPCVADCQRATVKCQGQCPCPAAGTCRADSDCKVGQLCTSGVCKTCVCTKILKPVCGADGKTYNNDCLARCQHVTVQCAKSCPC